MGAYPFQRRTLFDGKFADVRGQFLLRQSAAPELARIVTLEDESPVRDLGEPLRQDEFVHGEPERDKHELLAAFGVHDVAVSVVRGVSLVHGDGGNIRCLDVRAQFFYPAEVRAEIDRRKVKAVVVPERILERKEGTLLVRDAGHYAVEAERRRVRPTGADIDRLVVRAPQHIAVLVEEDRGVFGDGQFGLLFGDRIIAERVSEELPPIAAFVRHFAGARADIYAPAHRSGDARRIDGDGVVEGDARDIPAPCAAERVRGEHGHAVRDDNVARDGARHIYQRVGEFVIKDVGRGEHGLVFFGHGDLGKARRIHVVEELRLHPGDRRAEAHALKVLALITRLGVESAHAVGDDEPREGAVRKRARPDLGVTARDGDDILVSERVRADDLIPRRQRGHALFGGYDRARILFDETAAVLDIIAAPFADGDVCHGVAHHLKIARVYVHEIAGQRDRLERITGGQSA